MNKSFVTTPLGKLVESLLLENKLYGLVFSSFIWTIRNKMLWTVAIVALSSPKGFALEIVTSCSRIDIHRYRDTFAPSTMSYPLQVGLSATLYRLTSN